MSPLDTLRIALTSLRTNIGRSILTMLGVIIGVAAVIMLVSIGSGVQQSISSRIQGLGSNLLFVTPGQVGQGGGGGFGAEASKMFTLDDARLLETQLTGVSAVVPVLQGPVTLKVQDRSQQSVVVGGNADAGEVFSAQLAAGRQYTASEVDGASRVAAIGATVKNQLFPNGEDPTGQMITVNGQPFMIIGYYAPQGGSFGADQDNRIYMPVSTAQNLLGVSTISFMVVKVTDAGQIDAVKKQIETLLKPSFGSNLTVLSQQQTLGLLSSVLGTLTLALAGIAGISLLVGGIGIMNIMLVSVSERTHEIGLRKSVGATSGEILAQFVLEAVVLSVLGGLIGIAIGAGGALALNAVVPTLVTWWSVAIAFLFAAAVGVFFGAYPAWRASRLDPIVALRYE